MATTKLCMLCLEGILDAYKPGTLLDQVYRCNPFAQDNNDDRGDCVFELAPHNAPATLKELDNIQSFLVKEQKLGSKLLKLVKSQPLTQQLATLTSPLALGVLRTLALLPKALSTLVGQYTTYASPVSSQDSKYKIDSQYIEFSN